MPRVSQAHLAARREQVLTAACKCFSHNGFHGTTIRDVCREAGLSAGAVYAYFKSKDDMLEALAEMGRQNTRALLETARSAASAPDALAQLLSTVIHLFDADESQEGTRLDLRLWAEALHTPRIRTLFLQALPNTCAPFAEIVREGQARGEIASHVDADSAARLVVAVCLGLQVQKALDPATSIEGTADAISSLLTGSFTTKRSP
jgi:AcrR family transcriptional regulator